MYDDEDNDSEVSSSVIRLAREYATLDARKKELEDELDTIKERLGELEPSLLEAFANEQVSGSIKLKDVGRSVYVHRQLWARAISGREAALHAALTRHGLGDMVRETVSTQTLSAWVREQEKLGEELPRDVQEALDARIIHSIRTRRA